MVVVIDARQITDHVSFHTVFAQAFGFPEFYGKNMEAWIDCMSYLDQSTARMTTVHCEAGSAVTLRLDYAADFLERLPMIFQDLIECSAFVNWRRAVNNMPGILILAYHN
ncbi:barstar family protein [Hymenobacter sp. BT186]|uniref:Barstar family protein n=1 Tax=Hymenobacter telluris TaxID=2816474 RepID=A0A939EY80_9BACT|nr:barstar family protein [Hymenobacter telluris]MBO0359241.1 barstar family protein [Hymenobacter telluris]MBW3375267.1 barstar family protein [Hymenobacter norwichensis]